MCVAVPGGVSVLLRESRYRDVRIGSKYPVHLDDKIPSIVFQVPGGYSRKVLRQVRSMAVVTGEVP